MDSLLRVAEKFLGVKPEIKPLVGAGSNRKYYRIFHENNTYIGVVGESVAENEAFIYLAEHLLGKGKRVPQVLAVSDDRLAYIQTDLGDISLFDLLMDGSASIDELMTKVVEDLVKIEVEGVKGIDPSKFFSIQQMDKRSVLWDLNYFKYSFLKCTGVQFDELLLEDSFENMANYICSLDSNFLLYRDFQSRNMMVNNDNPYYIDFQGARFGPLGYDIVSFLYQAKANFSEEVREKYLKHYFETLQNYGVDTSEVEASITTFVLFRTLQVLGAYGFRGFFEKKVHFLQSIAPALKNLQTVISQEFPFDCSYLVEVCQKLSEQASKYEMELPADRLTVSITSFSYKKGIPDDFSGNGGGFVFDCRAIHNPGREEALRQLTGMDAPVIEHLDANEEMQEFLKDTLNLVDKAVAKYISRGFNHLMVSFGCTGGQHRSVYSAEHCAQFIHEKYPEVRVLLAHREQNIRKF
jgi:Predicted P-loop-containing kinase